MAADIPLHKLRNPHLVQLFADLGQSVPSEYSCRNCVETSAESETERLRQLFENKNAFVVIDETELNKIKCVNVLIGRHCCARKNVSVGLFASWNCKSASDCGKNWRCTSKYQHPKRENCFIVVRHSKLYDSSDCSAKDPLLELVPCHLCRAQCYTTALRKYVLTTPMWINLSLGLRLPQWRIKQDGINLKTGIPSEPALTRWGTWLEAANYYAENLVQVRRIVNSIWGKWDSCAESQGYCQWRGSGKIIDCNPERLLKHSEDDQECRIIKVHNAGSV